MSTHNFTAKDSFAKSPGTTTNSSLWKIFREKNWVGFTQSRERNWPSFCSILSAVCTAIESVLLMTFTQRNPMQQTTKHCLFAIPKTNTFGAVGTHSLGTNHTVGFVELTRSLVLSNRVPKFGKV